MKRDPGAIAGIRPDLIAGTRRVSETGLERDPVRDSAERTGEMIAHLVASGELGGGSANPIRGRPR